jgi:hypothetical protein
MLCLSYLHKNSESLLYFTGCIQGSITVTLGCNMALFVSIKMKRHFISGNIDLTTLYISKYFQRIYHVRKSGICQQWWCMPVIPELWRMKQEDHKFEASWTVLWDAVSKNKQKMVFTLSQNPSLWIAKKAHFQSCFNIYMSSIWDQMMAKGWDIFVHYRV